MTGLEIL